MRPRPSRASKSPCANAQTADTTCTSAVCQRDFIDSLDPGKIPRGSNLAAILNPQQRAEFRIMAGCLQWLCGQTRPELSATNSLSNKGADTTVGDLKNLYEALAFARQSKDDGFVIMDVPVNRGSVLLSYSDASWANAEGCRSQFGVLVTLTTPAALQRTTSAAILDWNSGRSQRVCRSTLAAEASAADEACDRGCCLNLFLSELLYNIPAHRVTARLHRCTTLLIRTLPTFQTNALWLTFVPFRK